MDYLQANGLFRVRSSLICQYPSHWSRQSPTLVEKVENWAHDHAAMVKRYEALLLYRQMQGFAEELTPDEMHQFYSLEGHISEMRSEEEPGDDIDSDDWEEPISHQTVAETE